MKKASRRRKPAGKSSAGEHKPARKKSPGKRLPNRAPSRAKAASKPVTGRRKPPVPCWDAERRELWLGTTLIKRYRRRAQAVQLILAAFEEEGWPARIDDPLPPLSGIPEPRRLRVAVENLNRRLRNHAIHFEMDGTGEGILWRLRSERPRGI
jgi:hypothetical protein